MNQNPNATVLDPLERFRLELLYVAAQALEDAAETNLLRATAREELVSSLVNGELRSEIESGTCRPPAGASDPEIQESILIAAMAAVEEFIGEAQCTGIPDKRSALRSAVREIVLNKRIAAFDKRRQIAGLARAELTSDGFFRRTHDDRLFYFATRERRLYDIDQRAFGHLLTELTGLSPSEPQFRFALEILQSEAARSEPVQVHSLAYYDAASGLLAVSDGGPGVWLREATGKWIYTHNGDDGRLFITEAEAQPFEPDFATEGQFEWFLDGFLFSDRPDFSREDQRTLYSVNLLNQFFPSRRRTRLIPAFLGPQGSGKTTGTKRTGRLVLGPAFDVAGLHKEKEDAFVAAVSNRSVCAFDNADSRIPWLEDALATYATGLKYRLRRLYSTNEEVAYEPRAMVMISSRDPHFKRADVAERLLPLYFERPCAYISESSIFEELENRRNAIWGELLAELGRIADALKQTTPPALPFRMADFAAFGWSAFARSGQTDYWLALLARLEAAQAGFASTDNALIMVLRTLLDRDHGRVEPSLVKDLFKECAGIAESESMPFFKTAKGFGQALTNMRRVIEIELAVKFVEHTGHARQRKIALVPVNGEAGEAGDTLSSPLETHKKSI
jgi:hypothetical protein